MSGLFAATFPERALGLILYGTFGRLEPDTGLLARLAPTQEAAIERVEREWGTEGVCVSFWAPSIVTDEETKSAYLRLARSAASAPESARVVMQMGYALDWEEFLPAIHVPTLVLHRWTISSFPCIRVGGLQSSFRERDSWSFRAATT